MRFNLTNVGEAPAGDVVEAYETETPVDSGKGFVGEKDLFANAKELEADAHGQAIILRNSQIDDDVEMFRVDV